MEGDGISKQGRQCGVEVGLEFAVSGGDEGGAGFDGFLDDGVDGDGLADADGLTGFGFGEAQDLFDDGGETVGFSWIEWPSKEARDAGWAAIMADPRMQPEPDNPFDGKRMFWGGFAPILDTAE